MVLEYGGSMSGEHGDGLARSEWIDKMFGSRLRQAFETVKETFDPAHIMNPGKIVQPAPMDANLRYGAGYQTSRLQTFFSYDSRGRVSRIGRNVLGCRSLPQEIGRHHVPVLPGDAGGKAFDPGTRECPARRPVWSIVRRDDER